MNAEDLKRVHSEIGTTLKEFKETLDTDLEGRDAIVTEKVNKMNEGIDTLQKNFEAIESELARQKAQSEHESRPEYEKEVERKNKRNEFLRKGMKAAAKGDSIEEAFDGYIKNLEAPQRAMAEMHRKDLLSSVQSQGGFLVMPQMSSDVVMKNFESSPMRQFCEVLQLSQGDSILIPVDYDEPGSSWVGEADSRGESDTADINRLQIYVHEQFAKPVISLTLLEDTAFDVEGWHAGKVSRKFARDEADATFNGATPDRPRGILTYPDTASDAGVFGSIHQVDSGSSGAFTADGLVGTQSALKEVYQPNARWMIKRSAAAAIRKLKDSDGRYLWDIDMSTGLGRPRMQDMLLGKPLHFADDMPAVAADALAAAYGDFREGYCLVDKLGISVLRDPYTKPGFVRMVTRRRVGGAVKNYEAIILNKLAA